MAKMMKLFIFEPASKWGYCGGVIAIVANNFNEIKQKFHVASGFERRRFYQSEDDVPYNEEVVKGIDDWVVSHILDVDYEKTAIIVENYNYA